MKTTACSAAEPASPPRRLRVAGAMLSNPGLVRSGNEDTVIYVLPPAGDPAATHGGLALVADGMGGHAAGEVASQLAAETIRCLYYELDGPVPVVLAACIRAANSVIRARSQDAPECGGMGTTCTALAFRDNAAFLAHVGDSRAYMMRDGTLRQISEDHSLVAALVRDGVMTPAEAETSPDRNVILRAIGTSDEVEPLVWQDGMALRAGDVFVLCSDGLSDLVASTVIAHTVATQPPFEACQALVDAALAAGGHDNVSVGVFTVSEAAAPPADAAKSTRPISITEAITLPPAANDPP